MKIAIIGSGISGLTAARQLHRDHEVTVFEANHYIGGHTNTIDVELDGDRQAVDTGFIVFNDRTYPNFIRMMQELNVPSQPTSMTFSVHCERTGLEYRGADLGGLFAQRRNAFRWGFYRLLGDFLRFNRVAARLDAEESLTVGEFFRRERFSREFIEQYFYPMGSAIWSCPQGTFETFPLRFVVEFYQNHGLLGVADRPRWKVICGGSREYIKPLIQPFAERIRTNTPVLSVERDSHRVTLRTASGSEVNDHVIFACHSDQALRILGLSATTTERELLGSFPYEKNLAVLHTDETVLPRCRRAWASWNYFVPLQDPGKATVTYNMNILQGLESRHVFCVTLNGEDRIKPEKVIRRIEYSHPIFTTQRSAAQRRHTELIGPNRTSFCGAYWGNGFHEDGVKSALTVCEELGRFRSERGDSPSTSATLGAGDLLAPVVA